ncbi:MAG: nicotinate-nucleotide adenylyltransferase [Acetobacter sp.]|nr:nicotinate-nucleotide adenylyltransferase [Acetobacter sp.]
MLHTSLDKHPYKQKQNISSLPLWGDNRSCRIGVLGGSFNPAHAGHLAIAQQALIRLQLDQVWLMVSPGNPLKKGQDMALFAQRLCTARRLSQNRRLIATDIEARLGTHYTIDTLQRLRTRFRKAHFIWLMGADGLVTLPRWKKWKSLVHHVAIAVFSRPDQNHFALRGKAAHYMACWRLPAYRAAGLAITPPPAWVFFPQMWENISATEVRRQSGFLGGF